MENWYVIDARIESGPRGCQGPFQKEVAEKFAQDLSNFVYDHSNLSWLGVTVRGPFFAVREKAVRPAQLREIKRLQEV